MGRQTLVGTVPAPDPATVALADRWIGLPTFYGYKDVLERFSGDTDQFLDAFCDGSMPLAIRAVVEDTMDPQRLTQWLLRRMIRQLNALLAEARKPFEFPHESQG